MYIGRQENAKPSKARKGRPYIKKNRPAPKRQVVSLVERGGSVRSFHVATTDKFEVGKIVRKNVAKESRLNTDESPLYDAVGKEFAAHETVNHSKGEYARGKGDDLVTTNSAEGFFGLFKRGFNGIYQHCQDKHLHRYLSEYDFRYNHRVALGVNDMQRTLAAVKGAEGKRLTYRQADSAVL
jgi:hypothetical protein